MMPSIRRFRHFAAVGLVSFVATFVVAVSPAGASTDLVDELPQTGDTVVAVDFTEMRGSPVYDEMFTLLSDHEATSGFIDRLDDDLDLAPRTDIDALVLTSNSPPLSPEMLDQQNPSEAVETATAQSPSESLLLIRGDFDPVEVMESAAGELGAELQKTEGEETPPSSARAERFELHVLGDETLAVATGNPDRLAEMRQNLGGNPAGIGERFQRGIDQLGSSHDLHMMIEPTVEDGEQLQTTASFAGLSLDFADGVRIGSVMTLEDEQAVTRTVNDIDSIRQEADGNAMTGLLGVDPLLENLSIQQSGNELVIRSSMTDQEATRLLQQAASILQTEQQLQQPLEGEGFETGDEETESPDSESDSSDDDGVDADFN